MWEVQDVLLVANPISGGGRARRMVDQVVAALRDKGLSAQCVLTAGPGDAEEAARGFSEKGGLILAFGGDGTFNEVLNGADLERCTLGVLPAGAGNVVAKELRVPLDPLRAVHALLNGTRIRMDVGICNGRLFAAVCGAGFDGEIVRRVSMDRSGGLSQLDYMPNLIACVLQAPQYAIEVEVDGRHLCGGANLAVVGNMASYGGPISLVPCASPTDGMLDVVAARIQGVQDVISLGIGALLRRFQLCRATTYGRGSDIRFASSDCEVSYQIDGDVGGYLPAQFTCKPRAMEVLVPKGFCVRAAPPRYESGRQRH